jgi:hypothetical protein
MKHAAFLPALAAAAVLGVAACGGGGGTPSAPAASQTTSASPIPTYHTAQPGEPALIHVPGYDYSNTSSADTASAKELIKADPTHFKAVSAHNVLYQGTEIGGIILVQVKPQADTAAFQRAAVPMMAEMFRSQGAKVTQETIHTEKVMITKQDSFDVYVWYHASAITVVVGQGSDIRDFVEAYLKTANA